MTQPALLRDRSFRGFLGAQFLGAFNDNLFKQIVLLLAAGTLFPGEDKQGLAFAVFAAPFVLLGGVAGEVSERFSKSRIMVLMKVFEIAILGAGMAALATMSWGAMLAVLALMGVHSAFFGPCKYGGLPEMVGGGPRLLSANAIVAMTTFLAVLLGGALPGPLMDRLTGSVWLVGVPCVLFAVIGLGFALRIAPLPPQRPTLRLRLNPFAGLGETLRSLTERPALFAIVIGMSLFWFNGGVLNQAINGMAAPAWLDIPEGEKSRISWLLMAQSVSIVVGSLAAAPLARRFAPHRVVLTGAVGMVAAQVALLAIGPVFTPSTGAYGYAVACLLCTGLFGALFFVPINAYLQQAIEAGGRGRAFAANNFLNFLFIFLGGAWYLGFRGQLGLSPTLCTAMAGLVMLAYLLRRAHHLESITFGGASPKDAEASERETP
jgi:MFS family permease